MLTFLSYKINVFMSMNTAEFFLFFICLFLYLMTRRSAPPFFLNVSAQQFFVFISDRIDRIHREQKDCRAAPAVRPKNTHHPFDDNAEAGSRKLGERRALMTGADHTAHTAVSRAAEDQAKHNPLFIQ